MTTAYDVPTKELIAVVSKKLQNEKTITPPEWSIIVRTAVHKENPPENDDWWYTRCASILRKIYTHHTIGIQHLKDQYSGKRDKGSKPYKARSGSGSIIRKAVQQLEAAGYVNKLRGKGRMLTPKGRALLDNSAHEIKQQLITSMPELKKY